MKDKYGRTINYIRISITDRCNLRCVYCMPEKGVELVSHEEILTFDEIVRICRCAASLGIRKVKVTGGEPLARKGCADLVKMIKEIPGIEKVTLTTNGVLLKEQMESLAQAGIDAVNISLDTLNPEKFAEITRRDKLDQVLEGIREALRYPDISVKINAVPVIREEQNFIELAQLARDYPLHVRFIEMMPIGFGKEYPMQTEDSIRAILEQAYGPMTPDAGRYGNGPGHYFSIEGFQGKIGFISAMTHKFCDRCNRVRLTADGYLKACLQYHIGLNLKTLMREGCSDECLTDSIHQVIYEKPMSHSFLEQEIDVEEQKIMSQIGG